MQPCSVAAQATLPMTPDRSSSHHPVVGVSSSGVPLVNIVAPNRAGVSLNNFTHYNVGTGGAVIVNTPRSAQTQIAGWVQGNPLMGNAPARVIINQVTSGNPTRLLGMTEVAGNRANLVIANPAGIACAGCGFINVPRVSLATGRTRLNADGSFAGFDVTRGRLSVGGAGLDARGSALDLIARAERINAQIWADSVRAVAGAYQVGYADGIVVRQAGEGERPTIAIDVHALGSMYANSVFLIGTEAGVGVRHSGELNSLTGRIEVSANGDVTIEPAGRIQAAGAVRIDAPNIKNEGAITSLQTAQLKAADTLRNDGVIAAHSNVDLSARDLTSRGVVMAGVSGREPPSGPGSVTLTGENIASSGTLAAGDNVNVRGTSVSLDGSQVFAASALNVAGEQSISTRGVTGAALNATLTSKGAFLNDGGALDAVANAMIDARSVSNRSGGIVIGRTLTIDAGEVGNVKGDLIARDRANIHAQNAAINIDGRIVAAGTANVIAGTLDNRNGVIGAVSDTLTVTTTEATDNAAGKLLAGGDVAVTNAGLINTDGTVSGASVTLQSGAGTIGNRRGVIDAADRLQADSGALDNRSGLIQSADAAKLDLHGGSFDNRADEASQAGGRVIGKGVTLAAGALENAGGVLSSSDTTAVSARSITNDRGAILSHQALTLESVGDVSNRAGQIAGDADVTVAGATIDNTSGAMHAGKALTATGDAIVNAQTKEGAAAGSAAPLSGLTPLPAGMEGATVSLAATTRIENATGSIRSDGQTQLSARLIENGGGAITSTERVRIEADATVNNTRGEINGGKRLEISANALHNDGRIESRGDVKVDMRGDLSNVGAILAGHDLEARAQGSVDNSGAMTAGSVARVSGERIDNLAGGDIAGSQGTRVVARQSLSNEGLIDGGATRVEAAETLANQGRIYGDSVSIGGQLVRNEANGLGIGGAIASRGDVDIGATVVENRGESLIHASNDLRAGRSLDADGRASEVRSDRFMNEGASIDTGGDVKIAAERFENVNANFQTQKVTTDSGRQVWHTAPGATERLEPTDVRFYHRGGHEARSGTGYEWALDDDQKGLLLPSSTYPFAEYAKYTMNGNAGRIENVHYRATPRSSNDPFGVKDDAHGAGKTGEAGAYRAVPEDMWAKFGVAPPPPPPEPSYIKRGEMTVSAPWVGTRKLGSDWYSLNVPSVSEPSERQTGNAMPQRESCLTSAGELCRPFNQWYGKLTESYDALNPAVSDYNQNVASRIASSWTTYDVNVKSTRDVVIASQPGRITAGRTVDIKASSGINDKSQILAGGQAYLNNAIEDNSQPKGVETFTASGRAITTWVSGRRFRGDERKFDSKPYIAPMPEREIDLPIASVAPANQAPVKRVLAEALAAQGVSGIGVPGAAATAQARAKLGPIEIRTVQPNVKLPSNALYQVVPDPRSRYLIETDPRFTNRRQWLSSEAMMAALGRTPGSVQKRLGDGFYEQQLVQRQIVEAMGQRFIGDYTDNQTQYQALMANGVKAAERFQMNVGTALTDAQMAVLTDDIVWLVSKDVTLADGTQQTVLVPQVYLRAHAADVTGTGSIVAGESVELRNKGAVTNSGTIASRRVTIITADSITNVGTLAGSRLHAQAKQDLHNLGGLIQGDAVNLSAGRDVRLSSTISSATTANGSATVIDRVATIHAGALAVQAGRDLNADAARIDTRGDASLSAARDVNLGAIRQSREDQVQWDEKNRTARSASIDTGTALTSGGRIGIVAGRDLNATAASVSAQAALGAVAGRDVNLRAGEQSASAYDEQASNERGLLSSKSTHTIDASSYTDAIGTTLSGDTVGIVAGNDLTAEAATIAGTGDVTLQAGHDLSVTTAQTASSEYHYKDVKKSGLGSAGAGIAYGTHQTTDSSRDTIKGARGSLIGSTGGSVVLQAGNTLRVTGSDILAAQDVTGIAKEVKVQASGTARHHEETHEMKSSGFTLAVKSPVIDAIQNVNQQARGAAASGDGRAAALHAMAAAGGVADVAGAAGAMGGPLNGNGKPEAKLELSFGASRSKTTLTEDSTRQSGSTVRAGGRAAFIATGEKAAGQGNVTIEGSAVTANDVLLQATDRVNLLSSTDTDKTRSTNESTSASAGVSFGSNGWGVSAAMSRAQGDANSDAVTHNNTHVQAGNTMTIKSGGDTNIVGANVSAKRVMGDIGGDLNIASEQDTVRSASRQSSVGGGFSVSQGGGSASFSARSGRTSGNYAGVGEQSGIAAGDGGFDIAVKGNTDLKGAYIASTAGPDKNRLRTGTLSFSNIENSSSFRANSVGISGGGGFGDGGSNYATHGPTTGKGQNRNQGGALPLAVSESGSSESLTKSAISAGSITVTDEANQKQDIATLNRDATNLNGIVDQLPDLQATLSNQADLIDAAQAAAETVAKQVGKYAEKKRDEALTAAEAETDPKLKAQYEQEASSWSEGGNNRTKLHIAGGALTGGLTGGGLGAVGGAAGAGLSAKLAPKFDALARSIKEAGPTGNANVDELVGNVVANVLAGGAGALVGGSTGALTSAAADRFNRQLQPEEKRLAKKIASDAKARGVRNADGTLVTVEQVENGMRAANNRKYGETVTTGMVVPLNANTKASDMYDATGMKVTNDGAGNNYLVQDPSMLVSPSDTMRKLIQESTGGANSPYSWNVPSPEAAQAAGGPRRFDPHGPFSPARTGCITAECAASIAPAGKINPNGLDYVSVQGNFYIASGGFSVNLHDGSLFWTVGAGRPYPAPSPKPGFSVTGGSIVGGATAKGTNEFLSGGGAGASTFLPVANPLIGIGGGISHSYGGGTAIEVGIGTPGISVSPSTYGQPKGAED